MNLVIVESPSKASTIKKYLGKGFEVIASKGHVVDLPKSDLGVDVDKNFEPKYVVTKKAQLTKLKDAFKKADQLILAVDLDREGEAIGWHVAQKLAAIDKSGKPKANMKVQRIVFHEISKEAILDAMNHPRQINMDLVNAQQARRVLDRLVGYKLSPLLWKKIQFGLSAGRVQSVAVRLIVEKELEREKFNSEEYWDVDSYLQSKEISTQVQVRSKKDEVESEGNEDDSNIEEIFSGIKFSLFKVSNKNPEIKTQKAAEKISKEIENKEYVIESVTVGKLSKNPTSPLITSTLQRTAVNKLGYSSKKTMMIAQKLYERGFITYMRTDSISMSDVAIAQARKYITDKYGDKYLSKEIKVYKSKSKNAQEAHECIRPVDFRKTSEMLELEDDEKRIYDLIWQTALASQMTSAELENISVDAVVANNYKFRAVGKRILFDGYLKVTKDRVSENVLPVIKEGDKFYSRQLVFSQHFTMPPARYNEASLIKKLEELGIGRPSTYASIISTILARKYVEKDGKYMFPTDMGKAVNHLLVDNFKNIVDYDFTAKLEDQLDEIADGKLDWKKMMSEFYKPFEKEIIEKDKTISRDDYKVLGDAPSDIVCPKCGSKMVKKLSRYGVFYSCSKFPDCDGMLSLDGMTQEDMEKESQTDEFKATYEPSPKTEDGRDYLLKNGKFGKFWAHPDYPKVKDAQPLKYTAAKQLEIYGEAPKTDKGKDYLLRSGKFGEFWAHPDYPKVKDIIKIAKKPLNE